VKRWVNLISARQNPIIAALSRVDAIFVVGPNESVVDLIIEHGVGVVYNVNSLLGEISIQDPRMRSVATNYILDG
jgi:hypothetical protein